MLGIIPSEYGDKKERGTEKHCTHTIIYYKHGITYMHTNEKDQET